MKAFSKCDNIHMLDLRDEIHNTWRPASQQLFQEKTINYLFRMLLIPVGKSMNFKCKSVQDEEKNSMCHLEETQPLIQESQKI